MKRPSVAVAARTDVGRVRTDNEDSHLESPEDGVYLVADGMGGHRGGEVASRIAAERIGDALREPDGELEADEVPISFWKDRIGRAIVEAGRTIYRRAAEEPALEGMGTTAVVLWLPDAENFLLAHVGDSRGYLLRDGELRRITRDHSVVQEKIDRGLLTREQARVHPESHILTRALGVDERPHPEVSAGATRAGDRFLLATDGLTDLLPDERIGELLAVGEPGEAADRLVAEALERGGTDNVTVVVLEIEPIAADQA